jgi:hypothetical protein
VILVTISFGGLLSSCGQAASSESVLVRRSHTAQESANHHVNRSPDVIPYLFAQFAIHLRVDVAPYERL